MCFFHILYNRNTKEIILPRRCYLSIETWRSILKWWHICTMFLKQLSSSNNRLAPKTSVKAFCPAYWLMRLPKWNKKLFSLPSWIRLQLLIWINEKIARNLLLLLHSHDITNLTMCYKTLRLSEISWGSTVSNHISVPWSLYLNIGIVCTVCNRLSENRC